MSSGGARKDGYDPDDISTCASFTDSPWDDEAALLVTPPEEGQQRAEAREVQAAQASLYGSGDHAGDSWGDDDKGGFFAHYLLGRVIGGGTFGMVRQARSCADGGLAAVKCVADPDEEIQKTTETEYGLMSTLKHPAIVHAEGLYQSHGCLWLVMELMQGGSLEACVEKHSKFCEEQGRDLYVQLLEALGYLHSLHVVHRDVKPANALLSGDRMTLKLADFNSAAIIGGTVPEEDSLTFRGTRAYSAPELVLGGPWDERVDVWACGICLYFMLRATTPFDASYRPVLAHLFAGVLPVIKWGGMSDGMRRVVLGCLVVDMHQRPAVAEILSHMMSSGPHG